MSARFYTGWDGREYERGDWDDTPPEGFCPVNHLTEPCPDEATPCLVCGAPILNGLGHDDDCPIGGACDCGKRYQPSGSDHCGEEGTCWEHCADPRGHDPMRLVAVERLDYLRGEIRAERISYGEIAELQSLAEYIDPSDVELLEWAGVPEFPEDGAR